MPVCHLYSIKEIEFLHNAFSKFVLYWADSCRRFCCCILGFKPVVGSTVLYCIRVGNLLFPELYVVPYIFRKCLVDMKPESVLVVPVKQFRILCGL